MDVTVRGRHTEVAPGFREHAQGKLAKVEKLDPKIMRVDVEVSGETNVRAADRRWRVELTCYTRGPAVRAEASAEDRYTALDYALARLKERLRKASDRRKVHRGNHRPTSLAEATAGAAEGSANAGREPAPAGAPFDAGAAGEAVAPAPSRPAPEGAGSRTPAPERSEQAVVPLETAGQAPVVVREKVHHASPMTLDQALFEMELVGHDFFLFRDSESNRPSVVYRRRGFDYGVVRLAE